MLFSRYKKKFRIILVFFMLVILISGGGVVAYLVRYSGTSELVCTQCHPEIVELWKNSRGHPAEKTKCYECHSRGFEVISKRWNFFIHARNQLVPPQYFADDEFISQRCLDCHREVLDLGYKVKKKVIQFTHRYHIGEGLDCVYCHRTAGHEYMTGSTNRPTVSNCLNCHLREFEGPPKNQKCLNCHEVMLAPGKSWQNKNFKLKKLK